MLPLEPWFSLIITGSVSVVVTGQQQYMTEIKKRSKWIILKRKCFKPVFVFLKK